MWTLEDASRVGASDMDRRACPSYEAGFDACDPLGTVLESSERGPARVLRRRCRSEGVDRSPFEDAPPHRSPDNLVRQQRMLPNKSFYTMKSAYDSHYHKYLEECILPSSVTGDHAMTHESRQPGNHQQGRTKYCLSPPPRPLLVTTLSNTKVDDNCKVDGTRLPKVEELFEKTDHEMMEVPHAPVTKQPLKSILNNPLPPKSPPPGILKKPKTKGHQDVKSNIEGRRRQRASSESDNLYCGYHTSSPADAGRTSFLKRAKDNSGTGYSYGSALATLSRSPITRSPTKLQRNRAPIPKEINNEELHHMTLLRTTAIKNEAVEDDCIEDLLQHDSPTPASTTITPALPVSSVTSVTLPAAKKAIKIAKKKKKQKSDMKLDKKLECIASEEEPEDASRSPSPDGLADSWKMETDGMIAAGEKHDKPLVPPLQLSILNLKKEQEVIESKAPTKSTTKINGVVNVPVKKNPSKDGHVIPDYILNTLRPSLFPRVPPYLKFINHDESPSLRVPMCIQKHLKWKLTTITPIVVKKTLTNSGFRLVKSECDTAECPQEETVEWIGIWGKHMKSLMFRAIKDGQKMNHFPGTFQIGRKDRLWRNLQKLTTKYGIKEFGIMPKTYVLPHDLKLLKHDWEKHSENNEKWIIKPPASARGTGIKVVSRWTQIPKKRPVVVQKYVSKPYLINGNKFDMRLYVLVTSVHPLRIYLYKDGLARFASVKYNDEVGSLNDRYMHLTNYSINRLSKNYTPNEDFAACEGHKWTLQTLFTYLRTEKRVDTKALWESMKDLVIKTIISGEGSISSLTKANITSRYNCYELFGVDVLLDENLKPWLLEVNISPSLHSASPLDIHVKGPLVTTVLNIAQFQVPIKTNLELLSREKPHKLNGLPYDSRLYTVYLSKEERDKHIIYTNMEDRDIYIRDILSTLTPDDVRHLIQAEDELTQTGPDMERVFPNTETHKYLNYLTGPRYYNRLFDAWETRYGHNRSPGIELLRNLCDIGYHLEVPPVPLKNDVDAPSPPVSARPSVPSLASLEPTGSAASVPSASRVCGDALALAHPLPPPPPLQPRA